MKIFALLGMVKCTNRIHQFEYSRIFLITALDYTVITNQPELELNIYDKLG